MQRTIEEEIKLITRIMFHTKQNVVDWSITQSNNGNNIVARADYNNETFIINRISLLQTSERLYELRYLVNGIPPTTHGIHRYVLRDGGEDIIQGNTVVGQLFDRLFQLIEKSKVTE